MKFKIKETGNIEELHFTDLKTGCEGCDMADDIIGNSGAALPGGCVQYNPEEEVFEIAQEDFTWWEKYFELAEKDNQDVCEWRNSFGQRVDEIISEELGGVADDFEQHHAGFLRAFVRIADEFNPTITVEQFGITRRDDCDDESRRDVHEFATFEDAFDFYDNLDLRQEWCTELMGQGREQLMKNKVFACSLQVNGEISDYKEYGMDDWKKEHENEV